MSLHMTGACAQRRVVIAMTLAATAVGCRGEGRHRSNNPSAPRVATVEEVMESSTDLWGEAALRQPGGSSYEFFTNLPLPPLRYCDANFRHYPITLSAPRAAVKARFVSNGSQINALARQPNWIGETGTPVTFRVGRDLHLFGSDLARLTGPQYADGYLPIVQNRYEHRGQVFTQEAFAAVDPALARYGVVMMRVGMPQSAGNAEGKLEVMFESILPLRAENGVLRRPDGKVLATYDDQWEPIGGRATVNAWMQPGATASMAIYTEPADQPAAPMTAAAYDAERDRAARAWSGLLGGGINIEVPEPVVNNAWRASLIGNFMLINENLMRYSQGNQYAGLYIGEGGDATRTLALFGHDRVARDVMRPLFAFTRKGLEFHQAGFKLQMLAHVYFLTRDAEFVRSMRVLSEEGRRPGWLTELELLMNGREKESGLYPPEQYAGDITDKVYSLNSNANGWRGMRDMAVMLEQIGERDLAQRAAASAAELRKATLAAVEKSIRRDVKPPFIPLALFGAEQPYGQIVEVRLGGYWNIMTKYVLGSGVFPVNSEYADALIDYTQQRAGLCMGMNRGRNRGRSFQVHEKGINDLYGMRYALALLERDEPDRALVSFYGKLAHGFTRDTFIGGEGSSIIPIDEFGRQSYLPPNSAANANYLQQLRYLLVQDYDTDDNGQADTLRLLFATPRRWLADGKEIRVERAPTQFGAVSAVVRSHLKEGYVTAELELPERTPARTLLRLRLPNGWRVSGAEANGRKLDVQDGETISLAPVHGDVKLRATVAKG